MSKEDLIAARREKALDYHKGTSIPAGAGVSRAGKIEVVASKSLLTQSDLSLAYTPGVAEPCRRIAENPDDAYLYTAKSNLVAVISNGTAVLGLGNIGPLASKPVMEGKAVLFKKFADIDCFDIEVNAEDPEKFIQAVATLEPTFGGINLEDVKAPDCFHIEKSLKEKLKIPVFHDDQHGTAIISGAALMNAAEIQGKKLEDLRVVHCGGGAASISCARFWLQLGIKKENCIMTDRFGVIDAHRKEPINEFQAEFAVGEKTWHDKIPTTLEEAVKGADVFMGCSVANVATAEMLKSMREKPIVFAMANPEPEIAYDLAIKARKDMIFATGRSDYPNQVNNVLGYPFIFRGALDVRAEQINETMKVAASKALARLAKEEVPEIVVQAYGGHSLSFGPSYIIPKPFDPRVLLWVAPAVAQAAIDSGVAKLPLPGGSIESYKARLEKLLGKTQSVMRGLKERIEILDPLNDFSSARDLPLGQMTEESSSQSGPARMVRVVFAEGSSERILKAAAIIKEEKIAEPVLLGDPKEIERLISDLRLAELSKVEIIRPSQSEFYGSYVQKLWDLRKRRGVTPALAAQMMKDPFYFAAMHVRMGYADAALSGVSRPYPDTIRPALQIVGSRGGQKVAGVYMLVWKDRVLFLADTTVNIDPDAETLADIAISAAGVAEPFGYDPKVAMLSFSNFGGSDHAESIKVREATKIVQRRRPDLVVDGEMQADTAVSPAILTERYPFSRLRDTGANVLVFPNLSSANICYKLLGQLGGAELVGPILIGMNKPIHVLQMNSDVKEIVNMAIIAVLDAQRQGLHRRALGTAWREPYQLSEGIF